MIKKWEQIKKEEVFKTPWFGISKHTVKLPDGKIYDNYYLKEIPEIVYVFAMTEDNTVLLLKEYKYGADAIITTIPAGIVNDDEDIEKAALRELEEETGYIPENIEYIDTFMVDPTGSKCNAHIYFASGSRKISEQKLDETEQIEVFDVSVDTLKDILKRGGIKNISALAIIHHIIMLKGL